MTSYFLFSLHFENSIFIPMAILLSLNIHFYQDIKFCFNFYS